MQKKVLADLTKAIEALGFESIRMSEWANTGSLSVQHPDEVGELASVGYNFQNSWGTMTFSITVNGKQCLSQPPRQGYHDFYMEYTNINEYKAFKARLISELKRIKVAA